MLSFLDLKRLNVLNQTFLVISSAKNSLPTLLMIIMCLDILSFLETSNRMFHAKLFRYQTET